MDLATFASVLDYDWAGAESGFRRAHEALDWLEKSYEDRNWEVLFIKVDPRLDPLRSEPRFRAIVDRMAFPE
ncbi:MAG: hypothetical protein HY561_06965 [Gemmatimonadetes bacterium]|nr:hypothetical protein [Gemmatimonadota bacterium]